MLFLLFGNVVMAQTGTIKGRVVGKADREPLAGASVVLAGTLRGTATNTDGKFIFSAIPAGTYTLVFSFVGYSRVTISDVVLTAGDTADVTAELPPVAIQSEPVVVTASKREQPLSESPVSVSVMDAASISYRSFVTVDDALRHISGVNITESQVNVRGSSGYSRGVGGRVLMLVDGIPFLTGDTKEMNFETIPVGQVERIEVVKGASSALYGSSALGGVINVITKAIPEDPVTRVRAYGGVYGNPSFAQWDWRGGSRFFEGASVSHSHRFEDVGLLLYGSRTIDDGYRQNDYRRRFNGYVKMRYDPSTYDALSMTFNILHQKRGSFLYWKSLDAALVPPDAQQGDIVQSTRFYLSGAYNSSVSNSFFHGVKAMWFRNKWEDTIDTLTNDSRSDVLRAEWQATWAPDKVNIVTFGVEGNVDRVEADLFGKRSGGGYAFYAQDEIQLLEGLKGTIGARYDFQDVDSLESSSRVNPKIGLVYSLAGGTALRGSYGGGFRVPSIAEAFITTQAGGLDIVPNPRLKPERSYSLEMGLSQPVGEVALFDLAIFHSSFSDLIEPGFVVIDSLLKGRFNNVVKARVQGIETSLKLGLFDRSVFLDAGYTYVYPKDLTRHDILKYRPRHLLYAGGLARIGWCSIGADFRYLSRVERIDEEFSLFITDAGERVSISIADVRLGADFTQLGFPLSVLLNVNNLLQYNYVELIGNLAPPRTVVLTIETSL